MIRKKPSAIDSTELSTNSETPQRRKLLKRAKGIAIATTVALTTSTLIQPAFAYWQDKKSITVMSNAGIVASPQATCTPITGTALGGTSEHRGTRISWPAIAGATGYKLHVTFVLPNWDTSMIPHAWLWSSYSATYPAGGASYLSQNVFTGLTFGRTYPAGTPTLNQLFGYIPGTSQPVLKWDGDNYFGQLVFQVEALFVNEWSSSLQNVPIPAREILGHTEKITAGKSATVKYNGVSALTDFIVCY